MSIGLRIMHRLVDWVIYPLLYYVVRYRRRIVRKNLRNAFPDRSDKEIRRIERRFYRQFCDTIMEALYGYWMTDEDMRRHVVFHHADEVNQLIDAAGGGIMMLAHMGNWEWMASIQQWLTPGVTELNVYRRLKSHWADRLMLAIRAKRGGACVEKQRILREMVRYRSENRPITVGLLSDQKPRPEITRTWVHFLHQETGFLDGGEVLAKKFGYPVIYLFITRPKRGYYYVDLRVLSDQPQTSKEGDITRAYANILEENILCQPELWLWSHNRWKWGGMAKGECKL